MYQVCLERCGDNIANDLAELKAHAENLTAVSFEAYDLGSDGSLVNNHFTSSVSRVCVVQHWGETARVLTYIVWSVWWCCQTSPPRCTASSLAPFLWSPQCMLLGVSQAAPPSALEP